jgi:hypothetical protein
MVLKNSVALRVLFNLPESVSLAAPVTVLFFVLLLDA